MTFWTVRSNRSHASGWNSIPSSSGVVGFFGLSRGGLGIRPDM
jgi:hypothetical protein